MMGLPRHAYRRYLSTPGLPKPRIPGLTNSETPGKPSYFYRDCGALADTWAGHTLRVPFRVPVAKPRLRLRRRLHAAPAFPMPPRRPQSARAKKTIGHRCLQATSSRRQRATEDPFACCSCELSCRLARPVSSASAHLKKNGITRLKKTPTFQPQNDSSLQPMHCAVLQRHCCRGAALRCRHRPAPRTPPWPPPPPCLFAPG